MKNLFALLTCVFPLLAFATEDIEKTYEEAKAEHLQCLAQQKIETTHGQRSFEIINRHCLHNDIEVQGKIEILHLHHKCMTENRDYRGHYASYNWVWPLQEAGAQHIAKILSFGAEACFPPGSGTVAPYFQAGYNWETIEIYDFSE